MCKVVKQDIKVSRIVSYAVSRCLGDIELGCDGLNYCVVWLSYCVVCLSYRVVCLSYCKIGLITVHSFDVAVVVFKQYMDCGDGLKMSSLRVA